MRVLLAILSIVIAQPIAVLADSCGAVRSQAVCIDNNAGPESGDCMAGACCGEPDMVLLADSKQWPNDCECCPVRVPSKPSRPTPVPVSGTRVIDEVGPPPSYPIVTAGISWVQTKERPSCTMRVEPRASARSRTGIWTI